MSEPSPLREGALGLAVTLADMGRTRLALAAVELEEERLRIAQRFLAAVGTLYFGAIALLLACACLVWALPPEQRLLALVLLALAFALAGAAAAWKWRAIARHQPPLLAATLRELQRDAEALRAGCAR